MEADQLAPVSRGRASDGETDEIDREEAAAAEDVGDSERQRGRRKRRDRGKRTERVGQTGEDPRRRRSQDDADQEPETDLADDEEGEIVEPVRLWLLDPRDQAQGQRDGHRIVATRLRLERACETTPDVREPERGEHGCGIGGRHHRTEEERLEPREIEERLRGDTGQQRRDDDADSAEECGRHRDTPQPPPRGLQTALEQDQDEADDSHRPSELGVVELDAAWAVGAQEHPERQEGDENRNADASRTERHERARAQHRTDHEKGQPFVHD